MEVGAGEVGRPGDFGVEDDDVYIDWDEFGETPFGGRNGRGSGGLRVIGVNSPGGRGGTDPSEPGFDRFEVVVELVVRKGRGNACNSVEVVRPNTPVGGSRVKGGCLQNGDNPVALYLIQDFGEDVVSLGEVAPEAYIG